MNVLFGFSMAALALAPLAAAWTSRAAAATGAVACILLVAVGLTAALGAAHPVISLGDWLGFGSSALRTDGLTGIFLALTGVTGAATTLAAFEQPPTRWVTALGATIVLAVAVGIEADNAFLFFLAWEMLAVCIYLIASADRDTPAHLLGGYFTVGLTKLGGAALLAAFALLYGHTHSFSLNVWAHSTLSGPTRGVLFALFLAAFGTKVGVVPVHGALPAGYGAAPRLGAAWLSVALAIGYYGLWRFGFDTLGPLPTWCGDVTLIIGALTAVIGIAYAITQDNVRRFLGYSTVEHAGIVLLGLGVALLGQSVHNRDLTAAGLLAASLHVCAHTLTKTLALIGTDRVETDTGQRTIDPLGGIGRRLPLAAASLGAASLTLAAVPPLGGFVSEWFTFEVLLQGFRMPALLSRLLCALAAAALAFTAGLGLLAFAKYYGFIFLGPARTKLAPLTRRPSSLSLVALGLVVVFLGAAAPWEIHALGSGLSAALGFDPANAVISHPLVLGPVFANFSVLAPTWLMIVIPAYATLAVLIGLSQRSRHPRRAPVWVTGSGADLAALQYRPSAYSNPMRVILRGPLGYRSRVAAPGDADADRRPVLQRTVVSAVDRFLYAPVATAALAVSARARRLQSGRLSVYLLYMLVALILALTLIPVLH